MAQIQQILECLQNPNFTSAIKAHNLIYMGMTSQIRFSINDMIEIIDMFKEQIYILALNNINLNEYKIKTNYLKIMYSYIDRYNHDDNDNLTIQEIIDNAWNRADKNKKCQICGTISVQNNLPAGNPPWMGRLISSYLFKENVERFNNIN